MPAPRFRRKKRPLSRGASYCLGHGVTKVRGRPGPRGAAAGGGGQGRWRLGPPRAQASRAQARPTVAQARPTVAQARPTVAQARAIVEQSRAEGPEVVAEARAAGAEGPEVVAEARGRGGAGGGGAGGGGGERGLAPAARTARGGPRRTSCPGWVVSAPVAWSADVRPLACSRPLAGLGLWRRGRRSVACLVRPVRRLACSKTGLGLGSVVHTSRPVRASAARAPCWARWVSLPLPVVE